MLSYISFLPIFCIRSRFCAFAQEIHSVDSMSAVTNPLNVAHLYRKVSDKEPHLEADTTTDEESRKRICLSTTKNAHFNLFAKEDAVEDMTAVYDYLRAWARQVRELFDQKDEYLERVIKDYTITEDGRLTFTHRSEYTPMIEGRSEYAFPCLTRVRHTGELYLYFISDPHNINLALDVSTIEVIQSRFLCVSSRTNCEPWILAEQPAITFAPPQYSIEILENIYVEMRKTRHAAAGHADPLCKLTKSDKLRVCASVMNSSYFAGKVEFNPHPYMFPGRCEFNEVSFLTDEVKMKADQPYEEWMLYCLISSVTNPSKEYYYFVSRAHQSHYAWVYRYTPEYGFNIENLSARISVIIELSEVSLEQDGKSSVDLVKNMEEKR